VTEAKAGTTKAEPWAMGTKAPATEAKAGVTVTGTTEYGGGGGGIASP